MANTLNLHGRKLYEAIEALPVEVWRGPGRERITALYKLIQEHDSNVHDFYYRDFKAAKEQLDEHVRMIRAAGDLLLAKYLEELTAVKAELALLKEKKTA